MRICVSSYDDCGDDLGGITLGAMALGAMRLGGSRSAR